MGGKKGKKTKKDRLTAHRVVDVPLREVSGVCLRRGRGHRMSLLAIGDRVAVAALSRDDDEPLRWRTVIVALDTRKARHNLALFEPPIAGS